MSLRLAVDVSGADKSLSSSWAHVAGRKRILRRYEGLYDRFPPAARRTEVYRTFYREGRKRLEEKYWSPAAVSSLARPTTRPRTASEYVRDAFASLFGRPGMKVVDALG